MSEQVNVPPTTIRIGAALLTAALIFLAGPPPGRPLPQWPRAASAEAAGGPGAEGVSELTPGASVVRELSAGEVHVFRITLDAGLSLRASVEPEGGDASVTLRGPDGREVVRRDCRGREPTPLSHVAEASGDYRLELRPLEEGSPRGRYELKVAEVGPATAEDAQRAAAERLFAEGEQLLREWKAESSRAAIDKYREALTLWRAAADRREEARALKRIGDVYQPLGEYQNALTFYDQALSVYRKAGDRRGEGETLNEISYVHITLGDNRKALRLCTQALRLNRAAGDRRGEARAINNTGEIHYGLGNLQRSLQYYQQALQLWAESADRRGQALALLNLGYTYSDLGQVREAFNSYNQSLALWKAAGDRRGQAGTLTAVGRLHSRVGDSQEALDFFEAGMRLTQSVGDPIEEARILTGMAAVYDGLGEKRRALDHYDRALSRFRSASYRGGEAEALGDVGGVYYSLGDYQKALECYQLALSIFRALGDRRLEIFSLREIGRVYDAWGDEARALEYYALARSFYRAEEALRSEADTLNLIGRVHEGRGEGRKALEHYDRALSLCRRAEYRFGEAATLHNMARAERALGNLTEARARAEAALKVVEALRTNVASKDLRASYFATAGQHYELYIDVLMRQRDGRRPEGNVALAFEASERARARSLLEILAGSRDAIRQGVDPELVRRERALRQQLDAREERRVRVLGGPHRDEERAALAAEIEAVAGEYEAVKAEIRARSPHYAALTQPQPLGLGEIQRRVLDDRTVLLEYALGDERSYLWAVTRAGVVGYELPGRARIEGAARRLYESLTAQQPVRGESADQTRARAERAYADYWREADALGDLILGPAAEHLIEGRRLIVVADGALQYIPFVALTTPDAALTPAAGGGADSGVGRAAALHDVRPDGGTRAPLFTRHEVVSLPSASILVALQGGAAGRRAADKSVAVFADPVFERDDPRIKDAGAARPPGEGAAQGAQTQTALRGVDSFFDGGSIPRLLASREEAEAIAASLPAGEVSNVIDFGASRAAAVEPGLGRHRVIHFATHGVLNSEHPEMSGIVLSLFDERGEPQDGFLSLNDIYNLSLPADLVVLSACNTALGKEVRGEGLIGLTRGFMYAGASSVVASLWKVDDEATAELMRHFYEGMFRRGLAPPAALRQAQLAMWRQKRWRAPYYWAAFVIQGQYGELKGAGERPPAAARWGLTAWGGGAAAISFAALGAIRLRRRRRSPADAR